MKVQPVQSTHNSKYTNFGASFVNDANGNFRSVWEKTSITEEFAGKVKRFADIYKNDVLEIT